MPSRVQTNEISKLQSEIANEIARDGPAIARMVFGEVKDQPDVVSLPNERLDELYRQKYLANDRTWLQGEAKRDPEQFLKIAERIGVTRPQVAPGAQSPVPSPGAFARAAAAPPAPVPMPAPVALPAPMPAPVPPPMAPPPLIYGPNGQPLPPSGG